jgi:hypothetical protein
LVVQKYKKTKVIRMQEYESSMEGEMYTLEPAFVDDNGSEYAELVPANSYQCKRERASPYPTEKPRRRPGRAPARKDGELNSVERERLDRRRERNRHAAARCRERRIAKISDLEGQVSELTSAKEELATENDRLQKEIENMRFQLNLQMSAEEKSPVVSSDEMFPAIKQLETLSVAPPQTAVLFTPGGTFSLTPLSRDSSVFSFPVVQTEVQNTDENVKG